MQRKDLKKIKFYKQDLDSMNFKKESFDAIMSIAVFHCFLKKDREKYINKINYLLRDNGILFQLVLSSKDTKIRLNQKIEKNTFLRKTGIAFHLFTKSELKEYFSNFEFLSLKFLNESKDENSVWVMILRKKCSKKI